MSVLIKGMKMPETCNECYLREKYVCPILRCVVEGYYRPSFCPIVPVPTPHGRLVDADKLPVVDFFDNEDWWIVVHKKDIDKSPTIIEAEEEGEDVNTN